jgi:hypothetical protein
MNNLKSKLLPFVLVLDPQVKKPERRKRLRLLEAHELVVGYVISEPVCAERVLMRYTSWGRSPEYEAQVFGGFPLFSTVHEKRCGSVMRVAHLLFNLSSYLE